jgi:hypothetical protein
MKAFEYYLRAQPRKVVPAAPAQAPKPREKGVCRHCGQKIGRGVHFHEKACKERLS